MRVRGAERDRVRLGPLQVRVRGMLPGEARYRRAAARIPARRAPRPASSTPWPAVPRRGQAQSACSGKPRWLAGIRMSVSTAAGRSRPTASSNSGADPTAAATTTSESSSSRRTPSRTGQLPSAMTIRSGSGIRALSADYLFESGFLVVTDRDVHAYRRTESRAAADRQRAADRAQAVGQAGQPQPAVSARPRRRCPGSRPPPGHGHCTAGRAGTRASRHGVHTARGRRPRRARRPPEATSRRPGGCPCPNCRVPGPEKFHAGREISAEPSAAAWPHPTRPRPRTADGGRTARPDPPSPDLARESRQARAEALPCAQTPTESWGCRGRPRGDCTKIPMRADARVRAGGLSASSQRPSDPVDGGVYVISMVMLESARRKVPIPAGGFTPSAGHDGPASGVEDECPCRPPGSADLSSESVPLLASIDHSLR